MSLLFEVSKVLAILTAITALYLALFMFEDEEGRWQNRIDELWIVIDDRARKIGNKTIALVNGVASAVTVGLDRMYGRQLLSARSIGASTSYSSAFMLAIVCFVNIGSPVPSGQLWVVCFVALCISLFSALLPTILTSRWIVPLSFLPIAFIIVYTDSDWSLHKHDYADWSLASLKGRGPPILIGSLVLSSLTDIVFAVLTRVCIRMAAADRKNLKIIFVMILQVVSASAVVFGPILVVFLTDPHAHNWHQRSMIGTILLFTAGFNFFTSLLCMTLFVALAAVLLHRVFWPVLSRAVYPLSRYEVFRKRKLWWTLSIVCFAYGLQISETIEKSLLLVTPK